MIKTKIEKEEKESNKPFPKVVYFKYGNGGAEIYLLAANKKVAIIIHVEHKSNICADKVGDVWDLTAVDFSKFKDFTGHIKIKNV